MLFKFLYLYLSSRQDNVKPILEHYGAHDSKTMKRFQNFGFRPQEFKREFSAQPQIPWMGPVSCAISEF